MLRAWDFWRCLWLAYAFLIDFVAVLDRVLKQMLHLIRACFVSGFRGSF